MNDDQLTILAVAGWAYLILASLVLWPKPSIDPASGTEILQHSWLMRGVVLLFSVIPVALVILAFVTQAKGDDVYAILALLGLSTLLVGLMLLENFRTRLIISATGIEQESPWRGRRFLRWDEIVEVRFSQMNCWFILLGPDGRKIRASTFLQGISALVRAFRLHLPKVRYENAYLGIEQVEKREPSATMPRRG